MAAETPSKKPRLSLSLKERRFKSISQNEVLDLEKKIVPKNTEYSTRWAMKVFSDWFKDYNSRSQSEKCPDILLTPACSSDVLCKWLVVFIAETRNGDGENYPPRSLNSILAGILRNMREQNSDYPNFLNKKDPRFRTFHTALDNVYKKLTADGVGAESSHTETITPEEEDQLWSSGVLNTDTPKGLLRATYYYSGKCFCLRGGVEQRNLSLSQLQRLKNPDHYIYTENASKNRPGGIALLNMDHKCVTIVANPAAGKRCLVSLLDKYISKLPPYAFDKDILYCRALDSVPKNESAPWYMSVAIGKNILNKFTKTMFEEAGILGKKTNHSLRVAGASSLFDAGVPERIIQQRTGHRSVEGLRVYERVTTDQIFKSLEF